MTPNLSQHILLDVLPENKRTLFLILLLAGQFALAGFLWAGETDFKTYRKAAQQEINRQNAIVEEDPLDFLSYYELVVLILRSVGMKKRCRHIRKL